MDAMTQKDNSPFAKIFQTAKYFQADSSAQPPPANTQSTDNMSVILRKTVYTCQSNFEEKHLLCLASL